MFLIAVYGAYEDCWTSTLRNTIREDMIQFLNETYTFFKFEPKMIPLYSEDRKVYEWPFTTFFRTLIEGKAYKESEDAKELILAFEKDTPAGEKDQAHVLDEIQYAVKSCSITDPIELNP